MNHRADPTHDVILVGGGLASTLTAYRLRLTRPGLRIVVLERSPAHDDAHTWSCFMTDLEASQRAWLESVIANRWPSYEVHFPDLTRTIDTDYARVSGAAIDSLRRGALAEIYRFDADVVEVSDGQVRLASGECLRAPLILDGRGATASPHLTVAFQKFVGLEVSTAEPHDLDRPVIMDAGVRQTDGFRFFYLLPLDARRLLIEDTRYSDGAALPVADLTTEIRRYARAQRWKIDTEIRREEGVLPIVLGGDFDAYWASLEPSAAPIGMRALLFHPTTGYSLPHAVRTADALAGLSDLTTRAARRLVEDQARRAWREGAYLRLLNRMLFQAAEPERRFEVLQHFYRLPRPLVERFYSGRLTWTDRARILSGRPPVPIGAALRAVRLHPQEAAHG